MNFSNIIAVRNTKTIYRDGDRAVKVFMPDYSKADILNEALNNARVESTGLNIPKLLEVCTVNGKWAIATEYIGGKTLAQLMLENRDKADEYLDMFVELQIEVHSKNVPMLNNLTEKMSRKIDETELDGTIKYDLHTRLDSLPKHHKLCHGDFNPSNIIITEDNVPYIIDWAHVTQGNASADVARTYLLFCLAGDGETAEKYLALFCKKSGTDMKYVQKWIPIVAASQMVKGKPEQKEMLVRWVDVVDYE